VQHRAIALMLASFVGPGSANRAPLQTRSVQFLRQKNFDEIETQLQLRLSKTCFLRAYILTRTRQTGAIRGDGMRWINEIISRTGSAQSCQKKPGSGFLAKHEEKLE